MGTVVKTWTREIEFGPGALTGSIGDSITVIPLVAALATNLGFAISGTLPIIGPILGIVVALLVHLIALALTMIGHTLQPLRLQYVEFFTKFGFYEASGRPYQPFKLLGGKS